MTQHTTPTAAPPVLLAEVARLLAAHRPAVQQTRCWRRLQALVWGRLWTLVRPTITQLLLALGLVDADWSAFYRLFSAARVDYDVLSRCFLQQTLAQVPAEEPYVVALDGTQLPRSSRRMPGTSWLRHPRTPLFKVGIHRAQRYLHVALLLPRWQGFSRAVPLRWTPIFPPKAVPGAAEPRREWVAAQEELVRLRADLDVAGRAEQLALAVGDGSYDVAELWATLPARTVLLARSARNRVLHALPRDGPGRGRPRRYGERAPTPQEWLHVAAGWRRTTLTVRGRPIPLRYRVEGPYLRRGASGQPLYLLVVKGIDQARGRYRRQRAPVFYLVNAVAAEGHWVLPLPATALLAWAWQRWEIEVTHREMKTGWGVGAVQCWQATATVRAVQVQVWTYALLVLAGYRAWGYDRHPPALRPAGLWWHGAARWSLPTLWRGYRLALASRPEFAPARAGTRGTWAEKEAWLGALAALLAA